MVLGFWDITVPIVGAPMAGGPGSPALAAAVSNAGGLGFIAAGYLSAERFAEDIAASRAATTGPLGVNLFVPQPSVADWVQLEYYAEELEEIAEHYHVEVGHPQFGDDDDWERKLEVVADVRPELVSFTFGVPSPDVIRRFSALGLLVMVTVTSAYEAGVAIAAGADSLVVQGPGAGGHRGTFAPDMEPGTESLHELIDRIRSAHGVPLIAAGGLGTAEDVAGVLRRGAVAAQVGTALLLSDEAGTNSAHRAALKHPMFTNTIVTRAFSGRYARGLENEFTRLLDHVAPLGYPEVNQMTSPIRRAAVEVDDPNGTNLWAGTAFREARTGPAADIVASLAVTG
jgi:nitronate monooxygenase